MKPLLLSFAICCCLTAAPPNQNEGIDTYLRPYVDSSNFSGTVLVKKGDRVVFQRAYGFADREQKILNANSTQFHIASMSMQFTAAAILRLVDKGAITLDSSVAQFAPDVPGADAITIRDLLEERSGLPDINALPNYDDILQQHQTPAALVAKISGRPLLFRPGTKFLHEEHSAYNLLALIIEQETKLPFAAAVQKLVFKPFRLRASFIDDDAVFHSAQQARGYQPVGVYGLEPARSIHWSAKAGNASVCATTADEAHWVEQLFSGRALSESSKAAMLDAAQHQGYGWFKGKNKRFSEIAYYMNGRSPGFASFVLYLPNESLTVVVFSNIYSSATTDIGNDIASIVLGLPYQTFKPENRATNVSELQKLTGTFQFGGDFFQPNAQLEVVVKDSELSIRWPGGSYSPLIPMNTEHFVDRSYWEPVTIERSASGEPSALVYGDFRGRASSAGRQ